MRPETSSYREVLYRRLSLVPWYPIQNKGIFAAALTAPAPLRCSISRRGLPSALARHGQQQVALATVGACLPLRPRRNLAHLLCQAALQSVHEIDDGTWRCYGFRLHG